MKAQTERRKEKSQQQRFQDVEAFWRATPPAKRRELLRVPMNALLEGAAPASGSCPSAKTAVYSATAGAAA